MDSGMDRCRNTDSDETGQGRNVDSDMDRCRNTDSDVTGTGTEILT